MTSYLIIDDEPIAHRIIDNYCALLPHLEKHGSCYNALEAIQFLNESKVDLIFLDINMPKLSGFDFLRTLPDPPSIIVTTAYKEFALEGYELNVSDYLLKPFSFERFLKAINKTINKSDRVEASTASEKEEKAERFFLKSDKKQYQLHFDDLLFVEAFGHYTKVHLKEEMILSHQKISELERRLPASNFMRVHKSFIIAKNKIKHIEGNRVSIDNHSIPIGQTYRRKVNELF